MTNQGYFCFTVDDVFLDGYSSEKHLENILVFCDERKLKATFFVVPFNAKGETIAGSRGYVRLLRNALAAGHEIAQHGITHDRFEVGIPPQMVLDLPHEGPAREYLRTRRDEIDRGHTVEAIREKLRRGRDVLENALGVAIDGFRAPALQSCPNMFVALKAEAYRYDSSVCLQPAAWDIINGRAYTPSPIDRARFDAAQAPTSPLELPLTAEYTWYIKEDKFDEFFALAKRDFAACLKSDVPFVPICHVSPIQEGEGNLGFDLYRKLTDRARDIAEKNAIDLIPITMAAMTRVIRPA